MTPKTLFPLVFLAVSLSFSSIALAQQSDDPSQEPTPQVQEPTAPVQEANEQASSIANEAENEIPTADEDTTDTRNNRRLIASPATSTTTTASTDAAKKAKEQEEAEIEEEVVLPEEEQLSSIPAVFIDQDGKNDTFYYAFQLSSAVNYFDNLDFRKLAPPTAPFIDIHDSDDRTIYATTKAAAGLIYKPIEQIETALSLSHTGLWGNDYIGTTDATGGFFFVERLFVKWNIWSNSDISLSTTVGRQKFEIGSYNPTPNGLSFKSRDFLFSDIIDGVTFNADFGKAGRLRLLPLDIYGVGARPRDINSATDYGPDKSKLFSMRFDGNYNTIRFGGVYENTTWIDGLALRAFFFGAKIGAQGSGSDRSFRGATGNVADNDYNWMGGIRVNYGFDITDSIFLGAGAEFAQSGGVDRKAVQAGYYDMDTIGSAFGGTLDPIFSFGEHKIHVPIQFFMATGGKHSAKDGLPYSHGFVSFKGNSLGGLLLSSGLGWRPSAYVGSSGVSDNAHDKRRRAGSMLISAGVETSLFNRMLDLNLNAWFVQDTSSTSLPAKEINNVSSQPAFGFTRADLEAQKRLGKTLATEIDFSLVYRPLDILALDATAGVLLPGEFYKIEIDRQVGTFLGSKDAVTGWAATLGLTLSL